MNREEGKRRFPGEPQPKHAVRMYAISNSILKGLEYKSPRRGNVKRGEAEACMHLGQLEKHTKENKDNRAYKA